MNKTAVAVGVGVGALLLGWNVWRMWERVKLRTLSAASPDLQARLETTGTDVLLPTYSLRTAKDALTDLEQGVVPPLGAGQLFTAAMSLAGLVALPTALVLSATRNGAALVLLPHVIFAPSYIAYRGAEYALERRGA